MGYIYSIEEKLLLCQCSSCKKIMEFPCDREMFDRISSETFRFEDLGDDVDSEFKHAVLLGICDECFDKINKKSVEEADETEEVKEDE